MDTVEQSDRAHSLCHSALFGTYGLKTTSSALCACDRLKLDEWACWVDDVLDLRSEWVYFRGFFPPVRCGGRQGELYKKANNI